MRDFRVDRVTSTCWMTSEALSCNLLISLMRSVTSGDRKGEVGRAEPFKGILKHIRDKEGNALCDRIEEG